ncbi:MAG: ATP-binding cassette domain-containing protein [Elusimicrobiota bacterium]|nr:ATP-binding cassette domain-containing protein [Elusimicrobiota bacterium]
MKINTENITKNFNSCLALQNVNIKIAPGKTTAIIGPNGAGKTTLLKIIDMIETQTSGEIYYDGKPQSALTRKDKLNIRRQICYVAQYPVVFSGTVLENLKYVLKIRQENLTIKESKLKSILELLQIAHLQNLTAKNLSYGEKQRLSIARALLAEPDTFLLDELTNNLDPTSIKIIEKLIEKLSKDRKTILLTTHNLLFARKYSQYSYFIQNGNIIQEGPTEEIFCRPISISIAEFIGTENIIKGKIENNSTFITDNIKICVIANDSMIGKETYATIRSEDILISNEPVTQTSARNCLKGKIEQIKNIGPVEEVKVNVSKNLVFTAMITKVSKEQLQLYPEKEIYLIFKTTAVHLFS